MYNHDFEKFGIVQDLIYIDWSMERPQRISKEVLEYFTGAVYPKELISLWYDRFDRGEIYLIDPSAAPNYTRAQMIREIESTLERNQAAEVAVIAKKAEISEDEVISIIKELGFVRDDNVWKNAVPPKAIS